MVKTPISKRSKYWVPLYDMRERKNFTALDFYNNCRRRGMGVTLQQVRVFLGGQTKATNAHIVNVGRDIDRHALYTFKRQTKEPGTPQEKKPQVTEKETPSQPAQESKTTDDNKRNHNSQATPDKQHQDPADVRIGYVTIGRGIMAHMKDLEDQVTKTDEEGKIALNKQELNMLAIARELDHYKKENKSLANKITEQNNQLQRLNSRISDMNQTMHKMENRLNKKDEKADTFKFSDIARITDSKKTTKLNFQNNKGK